VDIARADGPDGEVGVAGDISAPDVLPVRVPRGELGEGELKREVEDCRKSAADFLTSSSSTSNCEFVYSSLIMCNTRLTVLTIASSERTDKFSLLASRLKLKTIITNP
jgi:hypothetical protein